MEISLDLKERILNRYKDDDEWSRIIEVLDKNDKASEDAANLPFYRGTDRLIWRIDDTTIDYIFAPERLYISKAYVKDFFDIVYNKNGFIGRDRYHKIITR